MGSLYLNRLNDSERQVLQKKLYESQKSKCFICEDKIDLRLHTLQIDHVIPLKREGKDDPLNFALVHSSCNESKQDSDLRVARVLRRFSRIKDAISNRGPNLSDILIQYGGSQYDLFLNLEGDREDSIKYSLSQIGDNDVYTERVYRDELSGFKYFFALLPIEYLFHDDKINPRSIGQNISKLVKEFFLKIPQLHISLGWVELNENDKTKVRIFDGQHKAAAQVLLGAKNLPVRIFLNPDLDILLTANTHAGTTLKQVAFDKSVQSHLGNALYVERVERFRQEHGLSENEYNFSEVDLVNYYKGESREMKRYILDSIRDGMTYHQENKLKDYMDFGGRENIKPLSYSTISKTFYSFFIYQGLLNTPLSYKLEEGENPREIEKEQILTLMNIICSEIFIGKFNPDIGTRIENKIQKGEDIPEQHIIACRISKEEIMYNWLKYIEQIVKNYFIMQGKPIQEEKLFQYRFPQPLWERIKIFIKNLKNLPVWINRDLSLTVFGGKQNYSYWQSIFETGKTPQGYQASEPLDLMKMIKE